MAGRVLGAEGRVWAPVRCRVEVPAGAGLDPSSLWDPEVEENPWVAYEMAQLEAAAHRLYEERYADVFGPLSEWSESEVREVWERLRECG